MKTMNNNSFTGSSVKNQAAKQHHSNQMGLIERLTAIAAVENLLDQIWLEINKEALRLSSDVSFYNEEVSENQEMFTFTEWMSFLKDTLNTIKNDSRYSTMDNDRKRVLFQLLSKATISGTRECRKAYQSYRNVYKRRYEIDLMFN